MTEEEIIDYVMNTPNNSNPAVLKGMLSQYGGSGSGEIFWVTYTYDADASSESEDVFICDRTFQEIQEAFNNNRNVLARAIGSSDIYHLSSINSNFIAFSSIGTTAIEGGINLTYEYFIHAANEEIFHEFNSEDIIAQTDNTLTLYIKYSEYVNRTQGLFYLDSDLTQKARSDTITNALDQEKTIKLYAIDTFNNRTVKYSIGYYYISSYFAYAIADADG